MSRSFAVRVLSAALLALYFLAPSSAAAGGLEYTAAGATALGRGGAVTARADDPMVLQYNPAGLAELRGNQLLLDFNVALMSACVDPIGYYGWGAYGGGHPIHLPNAATGGHTDIPLGTPPASASAKAYYNDPLDTVCMNQHVVPVPQLIATSRLSEDFAIGGGFVFPAISPTGQWGDKNGIIKGDTGELRPAATRYMQLNTGNIGVFPTIGAAYRIMKQLRIGAALEWGMIWVDTTTMAGVGTGTSPDNDIIARIRARDMFVPGLTASIHAVPMDNLDIVAAFRYQDAIHAPGTLDLTTGVFSATSVPHLTRGLKVDSVNQNMPWKIRGGVRYADRLRPRPEGTGAGEGGLMPEPVHDAFQDERWDIEVDAEYQMNARNKQQTINYKFGQQVEFEAAPVNGMPGAVSVAMFPDATVPNTTIQKHWKNQISLRAGGSYNFIPGLFGVMGGVHYETRGIDPSFMQIDFWPVSRLGIHGGVTFRLFGTTDIVFSYAHIFDETIVAGAPPQLDANTISMNTPVGTIPKNIDKSVGISGRGPATTKCPDDTMPACILEEKNPPKADGVAKLTQVTTKSPAGQPPYIINSGTYRSSMNVIAVGVHGHF